MTGKLSHTQITTYCDCPKKWELVYKQNLKISNPHIKMGSVVHDTLCTRIVPDEWIDPDLKDEFKIDSWEEYYNFLFDEIDRRFPAERYDVIDRELIVENSEIKGIIDLILYDKEDDVYMLMDYKVTNTPKTYDTLKLDQQLYIYAALWSKISGVSLEKIKTGFISLPKTCPQEPAMLKSGTLSKAKLRSTSKAAYLRAIEKHYLNPADYEDVLLELETIEHIKIVCDFVNIDMLKKLSANLEVVKKLIDNSVVWEHFSQKCVDCEYRQYCKKEK